MSQPRAGASTDILVICGCAVANFSASSLGFAVETFAIQMITISRWILPVTSADFGRTSTFTSLRTPNSGR